LHLHCLPAGLGWDLNWDHCLFVPRCHHALPCCTAFSVHLPYFRTCGFSACLDVLPFLPFVYTILTTGFNTLLPLGSIPARICLTCTLPAAGLCHHVPSRDTPPATYLGLRTAAPAHSRLTQGGCCTHSATHACRFSACLPHHRAATPAYRHTRYATLLHCMPHFTSLHHAAISYHRTHSLRYHHFTQEGPALPPPPHLPQNYAPSFSLHHLSIAFADCPAAHRLLDLHRTCLRLHRLPLSAGLPACVLPPSPACTACTGSRCNTTHYFCLHTACTTFLPALSHTSTSWDFRPPRTLLPPAYPPTTSDYHLHILYLPHYHFFLHTYLLFVSPLPYILHCTGTAHYLPPCLDSHLLSADHLPAAGTATLCTLLFILDCLFHMHACVLTGGCPAVHTPALHTCLPPSASVPLSGFCPAGHYLHHCLYHTPALFPLGPGMTCTALPSLAHTTLPPAEQSATALPASPSARSGFWDHHHRTHIPATPAFLSATPTGMPLRTAPPSACLPHAAASPSQNSCCSACPPHLAFWRRVYLHAHYCLRWVTAAWPLPACVGWDTLLLPAPHHLQGREGVLPAAAHAAACLRFTLRLLGRSCRVLAIPFCHRHTTLPAAPTAPRLPFSVAFHTSAPGATHFTTASVPSTGSPAHLPVHFHCWMLGAPACNTSHSGTLNTRCLAGFAGYPPARRLDTCLPMDARRYYLNNINSTSSCNLSEEEDTPLQNRTLGSARFLLPACVRT